MSDPPDKPSLTGVRAADLHGLSRLALRGVTETAGLVEEMHSTIGIIDIIDIIDIVDRIRGSNGGAAPRRTRGLTGLVYRSVHGVTGLVGGSIELAFGQLTPPAGAQVSSPRRDALLAVLNGIVGDHLDTTANPLAIAMGLRHHGRTLTLDPEALAGSIAQPSPRLLISAHGLCLGDRCWTPRAGEGGIDLPSILAREHGYTGLHLHYNTGRSIAANGRDLAALIERLVERWPVAVEEVALLGHSMGGLVARSACHYGLEERHHWPSRLRRMISLGTPHHGSPLERAGHGFERLLESSPYTAPFQRLSRVRSAGILDLRHGRIIDECAGPTLGASSTTTTPRNTNSRGRIPASVELYAIAATLAAQVDSPRARLLGDGLVPIDSALGRHRDPARHLAIPAEHQRILPATSHMGLLHHPQVLETLRAWLGSREKRTRPRPAAPAPRAR